jgi:chromosome segregation protein
LAYVGEEDVVGPLTEVVQAPPECGDLVRGLLGGTLLVRNLDTAIRLWNRNGVWNSYVTLEGDVVTADGILIGGEQGSGAEAGVLARKREIRDLEREIGALRAERDRMLAEETTVRRTRGEIEERLSGMFRGREEAGSAHAAAARGRAVLSETLAQARALQDGRTQEEAFLRGELFRMKDELAASVEAARETGQARGEEEERSRALLAGLESMRVRMEECRERAHAAEVVHSGLEEKDRAAAALHASLEDQVSGKRRLAGERRQRRADHEASVASLDEAMRTGRDAIERAAIALSGIQERIEERVADLAECASSLSAIEDELRGARARESGAVGRQSSERLRLQRAEMDIAALDALIHQRYEVRLAGLVAEGGEDEAAAGEELPALESRAEEHRERMASMGEVNLSSLEEHKELSDRYAFLSSQKEDLEKSLEDLARAIQRINRTTRERFAAAFAEISGKFSELFPRLFQGGRAHLRLLEEENLLESGVEIFVQLPGKKALPLHSLSGGESALTAISLIFSIFLVKPSPFCLLDEVDAPLDDANVDRFNAMVREMSSNYQFLLITHNKRTMELADVLYGITMEKPGISKTVSVKLSA